MLFGICFSCYSYDANGNIKTLGRYDGTGAKFDELSYNYETKANNYQHTTNRLRWVDDSPSLSAVKKDVDVDDQDADNYSYDATGNLIADRQEEIKNIEWTVSGKVKRVTRLKIPGSKKPDLEFEYDASGQRIVKKVIKTDGTIVSTYYLRDATGNVMSVYEYTDTDNTPVLSEQYVYGSSRVGIYTPVAAGSIENMGSRSFGRKAYELSDHLGNVRATLSDYRKVSVLAIVQSATDYYPFGMVARSAVTNNDYRFGFNGKEHEDDITGGDYDFGARIYDSRIARWLAVDPEYKQYIQMSPYHFALNCPMKFVDGNGKLIYDENGQPVTITFENGSIQVKNGTQELRDILVAVYNESPEGEATIRDLNHEDIKVQIITTEKNVVVSEGNGKFYGANGATFISDKETETQEDGTEKIYDQYFKSETGQIFDSRIILGNTTQTGEAKATLFVDKKGRIISKNQADLEAQYKKNGDAKDQNTDDALATFSDEDKATIETISTRSKAADGGFFGKVNTLIHEAVHAKQLKAMVPDSVNKETAAYQQNVNSFNNRKSTATK